MTRIPKLVLVLTVCLAAAPLAEAGERVIDGALGGAAGGLVLGPVGLVGGALIGATAGPGIARSWGLKRGRSVRHVRYRSERRYAR